MALTTTISRSYAWRMNIMGVMCIVFALWGAYDLWVKIPRKEKESADYLDLKNRIAQIEQQVQGGGSGAAAVDVAEYERLKAQRDEIVKDGEPVAPAPWDKPTQWLFISSILFAPSAFWAVVKTRRRVYTLDDDGSLHMPQGVWKKHEIADIDMSRWMTKSIAHVVHADGTRVMLDDYKHKGLHLIIGAIASEKYPEVWTAEAKPRKPEPQEPAPLPPEEQMEAQEERTPQA